MSELSKVLGEIEDINFNQLSFTQKYSKDQFISDFMEATKHLSSEDVNAICDYYGFKLVPNSTTKTGYSIEGYMQGTKAIESLSPDAQAAIKNMVDSDGRNIVEKFTAPENKITSGNAEIDACLNKIFELVPEFRTMLEKPQHGTHKFDVLQHSLKVMQKITQNPEFEKLPDSDKSIMLLSGMMHDISKTEGHVDGYHAQTSGEDIYFLADRMGLSETDAQKLYTLCNNHNWLEYVNANGVSTQDLYARQVEVAQLFADGNMFEMAKMLTMADLKSVKGDDSFFGKFEGTYKQKVENIEEMIKLINSGEMPKTSDIPKFAELTPLTEAFKGFKGVDGKTLDSYGFKSSDLYKLAEDSTSVQKGENGEILSFECKNKDGQNFRFELDKTTGTYKIYDASNQLTSEQISTIRTDLEKRGITGDVQEKIIQELREVPFDANKQYEIFTSKLNGLNEADQTTLMAGLIAGDIDFAMAKALICDVEIPDGEFNTKYERAKEIFKNDTILGKTNGVNSGTAWATRSGHYANILNLETEQYARFKKIIKNENMMKECCFTLDDAVRLSTSDEAYQNAINYKNCKPGENFTVIIDGQSYSVNKSLITNSDISLLATDKIFADNAQKLTLLCEDPKFKQALNDTIWDGHEYKFKDLMSLPSTDFDRAMQILNAGKGISLEYGDLVRIARNENRFETTMKLINSGVDFTPAELATLSNLRNFDPNTESGKQILAQLKTWKEQGFSEHELLFGAEIMRLEGMSESDKAIAMATLFTDTFFGAEKGWIDINKFKEFEPFKKVAKDLDIDFSTCKTTKDFFDELNFKVVSEIRAKEGTPETTATFAKDKLGISNWDSLSTTDRGFEISKHFEYDPTKSLLDPYQHAASVELELLKNGCDAETARTVRNTLEQQHVASEYNKAVKSGNQTEVRKNQQLLAIYIANNTPEFKITGNYDADKLALGEYTKSLGLEITPKELEMLFTDIETVRMQNVSLPQTDLTDTTKYPRMDRNTQGYKDLAKGHNVEIIQINQESGFQGYLHGYGVTGDGTLSDNSFLTDFALEQIQTNRTTSTSYITPGNYNTVSQYGIIVNPGPNGVISISPFDASYPTRVNPEELVDFYFNNGKTSLQGKTALYDYRANTYYQYEAGHTLTTSSSDQNAITGFRSGYLNATGYNEALIFGGEITALYIKAGCEIPEKMLLVAEQYGIPIIIMND